MSQTEAATRFTEMTDDDVEGVVALWHACALTRPWNDPHVDIAEARSGPTSTILVFRDDGRLSPADGGRAADERAADGRAAGERAAEERAARERSVEDPAAGERAAEGGLAENGGPSHGGSAASPARGDVVASVMAGLDGHRGWLYYVAVSPDRQGGGLGRAAVTAGEAWLRAAGARKVQLMVRTTNSAVVDFYEKLGYADQKTVVLGRWF
ncbi:GNAT family N-acetyltransferase [Myceligenerans halotolerans]